MTLIDLAPRSTSRRVAAAGLASGELPRDREGRPRTPVAGYNLGDGYAVAAERDTDDPDGAW